jgi:hypothetical protein
LHWYQNNAVASFVTGTDPVYLAYDGENIWVSNELDNTITKLRAADGANLGTFATPPAPFGIAFDGQNIWVTRSHLINVSGG